MTTPTREAQLPHILRLLDDDSPVVRKAVVEALAGFGEHLGPALDALDVPPGAGERALIREILGEPLRTWLREAWASWSASDLGGERLEEGLSLLADFESGRLDPLPLRRRLDDLAADYRRRWPQPDPESLAAYLFGTVGLKGAVADYHAPWSSSLTHVLREKRGIPISLALIYMLVGRRLGLVIHGCNFPGHFLARFERAGEIVYVDCYHEGRLLRPEELPDARGTPARRWARVLERPSSVEAILLRVLNNLSRAYERAGRSEDQALMLELAEPLKQAVLRQERSRPPAAPPSQPGPV